MPDGVYAPFERHDQHGKMGMAPRNAWKCMKSCMAAVTILPIRAIGTLSCVLGFFSICKAMQLLPPRLRSTAVAATGKVFCRACLLCIGFTRVKWVRVEDPAGSNRTMQQPHAAGIVSNHCSWADILVHMAHSFPSFVARSSTETLPMIGFIRSAARLGAPLSVVNFKGLLPSSTLVGCFPASRWTAYM